MIEAFWITFQESFLAVLKIGLVVVAAGFLVRRQMVTDLQVRALSDATIKIFVPCLIFSSITQNLHPSTTPFWWSLPLFAVGITSFGLLLAGLFFRGNLPPKNNLLAISVFQNAGFMVLPIGQVLVPEQFDQFALYIFLYILAHNPLIWSLGKVMVSRCGENADRDPLTWKSLITPPLVANLIALFLVFTGLRNQIPEPVSDSVQLLGQATVPLATFVLGASLGSIHFRWRSEKIDTARVLLIKLFLIPAAMWMFLSWTGLYHKQPLLGLFLMLEAAVAPATSLVLAIRTYGGDLQKIGTIYIFSYLLSLFSIPFWVAMLQFT